MPRISPALAKLRDSLEVSIPIDIGINVEWRRDAANALGVIKDAARAYADLLENGRQIWWCESRMDGSSVGRPHWCRGSGHDECGVRLLTEVPE